MLFVQPVEKPDGTATETLQGQVTLSLAEAKELARDLLRAVEEADDHRETWHVNLLAEHGECYKALFLVSPFKKRTTTMP